MTKILSIDEFDGTVLANLIDDSGICVFAGEGGRRPLRNTDGTITRTFSFRVTATTKALARTAVNTFISSLRDAVKWNSDNLRSNSVFLREAADGETATRSLIVDFDAYATTDGTAIDAHQTMNIQLYVDVALTVKSLREEAGATSPSGYGTSGNAIGIKRNLYHASTGNTALSRQQIQIQSGSIATVSGFSSVITKLWIGIYQSAGSSFNHLWTADDVLFGTETTTATVTGSESTLCTDTNFTDTLMKSRAYWTVAGVYPTNANHAIGEFVALVRYKVSASGSYLVRAGIGYTAGNIAYNEPVLLDDSTQWRFAQVGVFKFPPRGFREGASTIFGIGNVTLGIQAQRLSGAGHLYIDTVTLIPYDHYIHVDDLSLEAGAFSGVNIITHENEETEAFSGVTTISGYGTVRDQHNWGFPEIEGTDLTLVMAAERDGIQVRNDNIVIANFDINKAFEAYHV